MTQRREFLKFLAASPLLTSYEAFAQEVEETLGERLTDPSEVINVFEMEAVAREKIPPAHFGYLATGVENQGPGQDDGPDRVKQPAKEPIRGAAEGHVPPDLRPLGARAR